MGFYTPEPPLEPPAPPAPDCVCEGCEGWFYGDERMYISDGRYLCPECFREELHELSTEELAALVGAREITAEEANVSGRMRYCLR